MSYVLALDQGTTSSRAMLLDARGRPVAMRQQEFTQHYPEPGWVEHQLDDLWHTQLAVAVDVLAAAGLAPADVAAIGIANQRETNGLWDRRTGRPLAPAIVWQDRRTSHTCTLWKGTDRERLIRDKTGLVLDPYFSATKLSWLLNHVPGCTELIRQGHLAAGTVDSWLIWQLTNGAVHATDASNASRTMLVDTRQPLEWDDDLLSLHGIPRSILPVIRPSAAHFGTVATGGPLAGIPIRGVAGDQQAALFGQACFERGMLKNTYGNGCFMLMNTGSDRIASQHGLLTSVGCSGLPGGSIPYVLEGSVFSAGATIQWLRDGLGVIRSATDVEALALSVPDSGGVTIVPAFSGLGAPDWDPYARGLIGGLTRGTTAAHLARAALESIALQVADLCEAMEQDVGMAGRELRVDGGAAVNNTLMQWQADLLQRPVVRPRQTETTALGAAFLAGLGVVWPSPADINAIWQIDRTFEPAMSADEAATRRQRWLKAVSRSKQWIE